LNTTDDILIDFQERLIDVCNNLCDGFEPRVYTFYDYIPLETGLLFHQNEDADIICNYIKTVSPIRFYLVGNDRSIPNSACKCLFDNELDDGDDYDTAYTFVENQHVSDESKATLAEVLGRKWSSADMIVKELTKIQGDTNFRAALQRANDTLQARENIADVVLSRQAVDCLENPLQCSDQVCVKN
jgi:hypothetical protein